MLIVIKYYITRKLACHRLVEKAGCLDAENVIAEVKELTSGTAPGGDVQSSAFQTVLKKCWK